MDTIAVIDDRADMRESVAKFIRKGLKSLAVEWEVIDAPPLQRIDEYPAWVTDHDVRVLVLDEKLSEEISGEAAVDYSGHQVAKYMRRQCPDLPQLIITAVEDSDELEGAGELDAIVGRFEFTKHPMTYVERMVRMGMSYVERNESELAELTRLSEKLVAGGVTNDERERLDALRGKRQLPDALPEMDGLQDWLQQARDVQTHLEGVLAELKKNGKA